MSTFKRVKSGLYRGQTPGGHLVSIIKVDGYWRISFASGFQPDKCSTLKEAKDLYATWFPCKAACNG